MSTPTPNGTRLWQETRAFRETPPFPRKRESSQRKPDRRSYRRPSIRCTSIIPDARSICLTTCSIAGSSTSSPASETDYVHVVAAGFQHFPDRSQVFALFRNHGSGPPADSGNTRPPAAGDPNPWAQSTTHRRDAGPRMGRSIPQAGAERGRWADDGRKPRYAAWPAMVSVLPA